MKMLEINNEIQNKVNKDIDIDNRKYFLNEQLKRIKNELGENDNDKKEVEELIKKGKKKKWKKEVKEKFDESISKIKRLHHYSPDYSTLFDYLQTLLELPSLPGIF